MSTFDYAVIMPKMSMTMEEGELLAIRVNVGDLVKSGDVLFDVATDKIDMEVESPADGVVKEIMGQIGSTMLVGAPVLMLETTTQVMSFDFNTPSPVVETPAEVSIVTPVVIPTSPQGSVKAVPKARVIARERGIDLASISPTGPDGTITWEDISNPQLAGAHDARKAANRKMVAGAIEKTRGIPQISLTRFSIHTTSGLDEGSAHLVSTWARILRRNVHLNLSTISEDLREHVGIALIMESKYGLAMPVFRDPDLMAGNDLLLWMKKTREQARAGKVPVEMLTGATASIFDLSHTKISSAIPLLLPSHTTALSVGAPNASFGHSEISLTVDLRFCDALEASNFLDQLVSAL
ncbi:MAG: biotin/lipoyl-containing protein [Actinomycetes bacterium]